MSDCTCCDTCCPEIPDITVNAYTMADGDWVQKDLTLEVDLKTVNLPTDPATEGSVMAFASGVHQRNGTDFTVTIAAGASKIVFTNAFDNDSIPIVIVYLEDN